MDVPGNRSSETTPSKKHGGRAKYHSPAVQPKHSSSTPIKPHISTTPSKASARTTSAQKIPSSPSVSSAKKNLDVSLASCDSNINTSMDLGCGNLSLTPAGKAKLTEFETSTIQKQRQELQLLIAELRDRDKELNEMVAAHQRQLRAWEQDRKKILSLEEKCGSLEGSVHSRNDDVRQLVARLRVVESADHNKVTALESAQQHLTHLSEQNSQSSLHIQELEVKSQSLNDSVREMTGNIGDLEAREEELISVLQKKDRDLSDASTRIAELSAKLKRVDGHLHESQAQSSDLRRQVSEWKNRQSEAAREVDHLKRELIKAEHHSEQQHLEMQKQKQEITTLKKEIMLTTEREKRKDQLLQLQKSKQERSDAELTDLRQLYERQQRDLSLLHLNLESTRELLAKQQGQFSLDRSFLEGDINRSQRSLVRRHSPSTTGRSSGSKHSPITADYRFADSYTSPRSVDYTVDRSTAALSPHSSPGHATRGYTHSRSDHDHSMPLTSDETNRSRSMPVTDLYYTSPMHPGSSRVRFSPTSNERSTYRGEDYSSFLRGASPISHSAAEPAYHHAYQSRESHPLQTTSEPVLPEPKHSHSRGDPAAPSSESTEEHAAPPDERDGPHIPRDDQASAHSTPESQGVQNLTQTNGVQDSRHQSSSRSSSVRQTEDGRVVTEAPPAGQNQHSELLPSPVSSGRHSVRSQLSRHTVDASNQDQVNAIKGDISRDGSIRSLGSAGVKSSRSQHSVNSRKENFGASDRSSVREQQDQLRVYDQQPESQPQIVMADLSSMESAEKVAAWQINQQLVETTDQEIPGVHHGRFPGNDAGIMETEQPSLIGSDFSRTESARSHHSGVARSCDSHSVSHHDSQSLHSAKSHESGSAKASGSHHGSSRQSHESSLGSKERSRNQMSSRSPQQPGSHQSSLRSHHSDDAGLSHKSHSVTGHHDSSAHKSHESGSVKSYLSEDATLSHHSGSARSHRESVSQSHPSMNSHESANLRSHPSNDSIRSSHDSMRSSHESMRSHESISQQSHHSDHSHRTADPDITNPIPEITPYQGREWELSAGREAEEESVELGPQDTFPDPLELSGVGDMQQLTTERSSTPVSTKITGRELQSPATKLHTLLTESQELAKDLERSSLANQSQESRELDQSAHRKDVSRPGLTNGSTGPMPSNVGTNQNGVDLHPANESAEFELSIVADDIEQEED